MRKATFLVMAASWLAACLGSLTHAQSPAAPGQGWTKDESRRLPTRPTELGYIVGSVLKVSVNKENNRFIITLDNGQRWSQIQTKPDVVLSVGDEVRIQKSSIGSYMLTTEKGIETRVRRDR